jgi:hypothetical protein
VSTSRLSPGLTTTTSGRFSRIALVMASMSAEVDKPDVPHSLGTMGNAAQQPGEVHAPRASPRLSHGDSFSLTRFLRSPR